MEVKKDIIEYKNELEKQKIQNKNYLRELQRFFDLADNIQNEKLRKRIIYQMLKCDETITKTLEDKIYNKLMSNKKIKNGNTTKK